MTASVTVQAAARDVSAQSINPSDGSPIAPASLVAAGKSQIFYVHGDAALAIYEVTSATVDEPLPAASDPDVPTYDWTEIDALIGVTLTAAEQLANGSPDGDEALVFTLDDGRKYAFFHEQDCCESVSIEDITGDLNDLVGSPIVRAEERVNHTDDNESSTWTFYEFATAKGSVTVRWYGNSNGYYSEDVSHWFLDGAA